LAVDQLSFQDDFSQIASGARRRFQEGVSMHVKYWTRRQLHLPGEQIQRAVLALCMSMLPGGLLMAQEPSEAPPTPTPLTAPVSTLVGVALEDLLKEAEQNNPQIRAAKQAWDAAKLAPSQKSALPDPEFLVHHVSVGSPRPFAGYTNSDFAYLGLGISQEFPYPGKRGLQSDIARRDAEIARETYETVRRSVRADLKETYLQLAYVFETLRTLEAEGQLLQRLQQAADVRYRSGLGNQQDLLRAQLEQTKYLAEISHHDLEAAKLQYRIKQLLNRSPSFSDVAPSAISETTLDATYYDLLAAARGQSPELAAAELAVEKQRLQVDLARKDLYPDFSIHYEWQRTDPTRFRAYYSLTFGVKVPIYKGKKQEPALAQAQNDLLRSRSAFESQGLALEAELGAQYATEQRTRDLLRIYREGLLPQARGLADSALAAYENSQLEFAEVLSALLEISRLNSEYWQILADHETAIGRIEEITGLALRTGQAIPAVTP
jgi:outer membrane protein TolC